MKASLTLLLLSAAALTVVVVTADDRYAKYDNVDVDRMLRNQRFVSATIKCLMEEGPCTPETRDLKKMLPDALKSDCSKCSARQKENVRKVVDFMMRQRAVDWERLSRKYDPDGHHKKRLEARLQQRAAPTTR